MHPRRLASWLRLEASLIWSVSSVSIRPAISRRRADAWAGNTASNSPSPIVSVARLFTLFTFCPPGPPERENVKRNAEPGSETPGASGTRLLLASGSSIAHAM